MYRRRLTLVLACVALGAAGAADEAARARRRTPVVEVFEKCRDAVVNISTTRVVRLRSLWGSPLEEFFDPGPARRRERRVQSIGSGVVIHPAGYIVTNAHVVSQASDVRVALADEQSLPAGIIAVDNEHDLAVLKVDPPQPLHAVTLGRSDDLMIGETVVAIGNPLGLQHTVTAGIVSALNRELQFSEDVVYRGLIQTDAPINPGNSGGPLLNVNGELIGINSAIRGDAQNIGFAIAVDRLWELLPDLFDVERRARVRFGLRVRGPAPTVAAVRAGSPAAKAGVRTGDRITALAGQPVADAIDFYANLLAQKPDQVVRLTVQREGRSLALDVPLESVPIPDGQKLAQSLLGLRLGDVPADVRREFDLPPGAGLLVEGVIPGGAGDRARMRPGDVILRLDRTPMTSLSDVGLALERVKAGDEVRVDGLRLAADPPFFWTVTLRARGSGV